MQRMVQREPTRIQWNIDLRSFKIVMEFHSSLAYHDQCVDHDFVLLLPVYFRKASLVLAVPSFLEEHSLDANWI